MRGVPVALAAALVLFAEDAGAQVSPIRVPFDFVGNHVYVQAHLPGSAPLWFLLDTGATASYLDAGRAKEMALWGAGDQVSGTTITLHGLDIPGQNFHIQPLGFWIYDGHAVDGILGYDFLRRFVVEIDYESRTVVLHDPSGFSYSGTGDILPMVMLEDDSGGKVPLVRATVLRTGRPPVEGQFIADIAVRAALSFNTPFVRANDLLESFDTVMMPIGGGALVRESRQAHGRIEAVRLGRFEFEGPIAVLFQDEEGIVASPEFDGVIGGEILRRFTVIFDYSRERLILEPNPDFEEPFEHDMSGVLLAAEGVDFKTARVRAVMPGSPAAEAGLRENDSIISIGGQRTADLSVEQVKEMFRRSGETYQIEIEREGQVIRTTIVLRRLI